METEVFRIETPEQFRRAVDRATELLGRGEVVAIPTETVYGLAANALDERAVRRIYEAKGRPAENPLIVHVASLEMARACARSWSRSARSIAEVFWPGPLTIVLAKTESIPPIVTAGGDTVGIRWPLHPFAQELIRRGGFPIAAPSANRANELSPTSAEHVLRGLNRRIPLIVDAGPASVGIESTVLDLSGEEPRILRPGMISAEQIAEVLGLEILQKKPEGKVLKSPGLMRKHYAPRAKLVIEAWRSEHELRDIVDRFGVPLPKITVIAHDVIPQSNPFGRVAIIPQDAEAYGRALYAELHRCDELGAELIVVEKVPPGEQWQGIRDRLRRASAQDGSHPEI